MKSKNKFFLLVGILIFSSIVATVSGYYGLNVTSLESFVSANYFLSAVTYLILFVVLTSFSFSVSVMTSLGTVFFSSYVVIAISMAGILGSSIVDFYIARKLGRDYVKSYLEKRGGKIEKFDKTLEKDTFKTIFILSAIFFVPPTIPNFLGGIIKIKLKDYIIATFLGNLVNTIFTVWLIEAFIYDNTTQIYACIIAMVINSIICIYFYKGELKDILKITNKKREILSLN